MKKFSTKVITEEEQIQRRRNGESISYNFDKNGKNKNKEVAYIVSCEPVKHRTPVGIRRELTILLSNSTQISQTVELTIRELIDMATNDPTNPMLLLNTTEDPDRDKVQRANVTSTKKKSEMIIGIWQNDQMLPAVQSQFSCEEGNLHVSDGMQRCTTLLQYVSGELQIRQTGTAFDGTRFSDFSEEEQEFFLSRKVIFQITEFISLDEFACCFHKYNTNRTGLTRGEHISGRFSTHPFIERAVALGRNPAVVDTIRGKDDDYDDKRKVNMLTILGSVALAAYMYPDTEIKCPSTSSVPALVETFMEDVKEKTSKNRHLYDVAEKIFKYYERTCGMLDMTFGEDFTRPLILHNDAALVIPDNNLNDDVRSIYGLDKCKDYRPCIRNLGKKKPTSFVFPLLALVALYGEEIYRMRPESKQRMVRRIEMEMAKVKRGGLVFSYKGGGFVKNFRVCQKILLEEIGE